MDNFELYNPVRVEFGVGQVDQLDRLVPTDAKVLLTYGGGSVKRTGVLEAVRKSLAPRQLVEFGGIEPNPRYETLLKALPIIEKEGIDFILAIGGGSVIDGTKFIAAAACFEGEDKLLILKKRGTNVVKALPFGAVLTLSATGSEMNKGAVVTIEATHEKLAFSSELTFPQFAIVDPAYTLTLPMGQVANGIIDSLVHVLEQYLTYPVDARVQDRFAESLVATIIEIGPEVMEHPDDIDLRKNLSMCAMMALNGLIRSGIPEDWSTHMIGHELTAIYGIDHAVSLAVVLPSLLRETIEDKREKLTQLGERVFDLGNAPDVALATIEVLEQFCHQIMRKAIVAACEQIKPEGIDMIVNRFTERRWTLGERRNLTPERIRIILERSLNSSM